MPRASEPDASASTSDAVDLNRNRPVIGIALKVLAALVFTGMVALVKISSETVPTGEIVFARSFFGIIPVLMMVAFRGELRTVCHTQRLGAHILRGMIGVTAMGLWFLALARLPIPDATAISFAAPLMTVVLAAVALGETVRIYRWSAVAAGFIGILVILSPHIGQNDFTGDTTVGAMLAFGSACFMAFAVITVRTLTKTERTSTIVVWFSLTTCFFSLLSLPFGWVIPDLEGFLILVMIGLLGGVGQILQTQSYRFADASTIAPFEYTTMIWAIIVGWFLFEDVPAVEVLIGSAVVVAAGLFVIYREHKLGLDRSKTRRASTPSRV